MMGNVKIASLNCRGLGDNNKRKDVFNYLKQKKFSIYCLQDTHFTEKNEKHIRAQWGFDCVFSHGTNVSRGVCILFNNTFEYKILQQKTDLEGNFIILKLELEKNITMTLVNFYGPNKDNPSFYNNLMINILELETDSMIICGDTNTVQEYDLDCFNYQNRNNPKNREALLNIRNTFHLVDPWRIYHPNIRRYTWFRRNPVKKARLDLFLVSEELMNIIEKPDILPGYRTDHSIITIDLRLSTFKKGKGFWKFNNLLLKDKLYIEKVKEVILETKCRYACPIYNRDTLELLDPHDVQFTISDQLFFETLLLNIRTMTIPHSAKRKKNREIREKELEKQIKTIQNILCENHNAILEEILHELMTELEEIREDYMKGLLLRAKANWVEKGEKPTKYFLSLEKRNYVNKNITKLVTEQDRILSGQEEILREVKNYFSNLYDNKDVNYEEKELDNLLSEIDIPKLDYDMRERLETPLTIDELSKALKSMKNDKSPGPDGYTSEFFKFFWKDLKYYLLRSYNEGIRKGELSITQTQGIISIIPKGNKTRELLKNWRPISLLNITYKILSSSIAARMKEILEQIINEDQKGFIKNRYIGENIRHLYDIIDITKDENIQGLVLLVDFEKAFDSISWKFIDKTLTFFNFGPVFRHTIKTLYNNAKLCVIQHGIFSEFFKIGRGCRQGDPVSPYLFIVCVEILGALIRKNERIRGIKIGAKEYKCLFYADDTAITLDGTEQSLKNTLTLLEQFAKYSGLKPNIEKTKCIWIGSSTDNNYRLCQDSNLSWSREPFNFLGVIFSTKLSDIPKLNYEDKVNDIKKMIHVWSKRSLSTLAKITVVKSLIIPKITHLLISLPGPGYDMLQSIESMIYNFIWNGKKDRISRKQLVQTYSNGGLKMIHLPSFMKKLKLSWLRRILCNDTTWLDLFLEIIKKDVKNLWVLGNEYLNIMANKIKNPFWKEVLNTLYEFRNLITMKPTDIIYQPLWYNNKIKIGGKYVFYKQWFDKGIHRIYDICNIDGSLLSYNEFQEKHGFNPDFVSFMGLRNSILSRWNMFKNVNCYTLPYCPEDIKLLKDRSNLQSVYKIFIGNINIQQKYKTNWNKYINIDTNINWKKINIIPFESTTDSKYRWFQYRIIHRIICTNKLLYKMKILQSPLCTFCKSFDESIFHIFCECDIIQDYWNEVESLILQKTGRIIPFTSKNIIFGITSSHIDVKTINVLILIGKYHIYKQKLRNLRPCANGFKRELEYYINTEKIIAIKNSNYDKFQKTWKVFGQIIDQ